MNENYLKIKEQTLVDIADAIRSRTGETDLITVSNLDDKIKLLSLSDGSNLGDYAWKKYSAAVGNVETLPATSAEVTGMATPKAQFTVSDFAWQAGDTVTFTINNQVFIVENIGEPTESVELLNEQITEPHYIYHVEGDELYIQLELNGNDQSLDSATLAISVEKIVKGDFIEFAVADPETTYPDNGLHVDGYWYEKVSLEPAINTEGMYCWAKFADGSNLLPNGYKEVEYLEANGTQVIDLGIVPTANTRITGKFRYTVSDNFFFGAESSWMNNSFDLLVSANVLTAIYGTTRTALGTFKNADFELDWNGNSVSVNGNVTTLPAATVSSGRPLYLFASNRGGSVVDKITGRVYSGFKIYADGSTLSGDFATCIDANDVPCIYNRVTGETLYDMGGASFTTGATCSSPTPDSYVLSDNLNAYPQDGTADDGYYYSLMNDTNTLSSYVETILSTAY